MRQHFFSYPRVYTFLIVLVFLFLLIAPILACVWYGPFIQKFVGVELYTVLLCFFVCFLLLQLFVLFMEWLDHRRCQPNCYLERTFDGLWEMWLYFIPPMQVVYVLGAIYCKVSQLRSEFVAMKRIAAIRAKQ